VIAVRAANGRMNGLAFRPDGRHVAGASRDGFVRVWEPDQVLAGAPVWQSDQRHRGELNHLVYSPCGKWVFACGDSGGALVWPADGGECAELPQPPNQTYYTNVIVCSPDGRFVAWAGGYRGQRSRIAVAHVKSRKLHKQFDGHNEAVGILAPGPDGLASGSADRTIRFWDWDTGRKYHELTMRGFVRALAFAPSGDWLAGSCAKGVMLWPMERVPRRKRRVPGAPRELKGHTKTVSCIEFAPDGLTLASSGDDGTLRLWDAASGTEKRAFHPRVGALHWIAFAPDGLTVAVTSDKGHLVLIDLGD